MTCFLSQAVIKTQHICMQKECQSNTLHQLKIAVCQMSHFKLRSCVLAKDTGPCCLAEYSCASRTDTGQVLVATVILYPHVFQCRLLRLACCFAKSA